MKNIKKYKIWSEEIEKKRQRDIDYLWSVVNDAETKYEIDRAGQLVFDACISNSEYNNLMSAISYKTRELYSRR